MSTYILARDADASPAAERQQTVLFNAASMVYIEVALSEIGGAHVLRARFSEGNGHYTRNIHTLRGGDPLHNLGSIVLPYLRRCVLHGIAVGLPVIDEIFLGVCLDRFRNDAAAVVMVESIVGEFAHRTRVYQDPLVELSRGCWYAWRILESFTVVDGGEAQRETRAQIEARMRVAGRPATAWAGEVIPHWYLCVSGTGGGDDVTWKLGGDITSEALAADWCRWWVNRRGLQTSWDQWWEAHDRIVGGNIIQRADGYRTRQPVETSPEALRHLDLGNDHVGADGGVAMVQPGAAADDRSGAAVPSPTNPDAAAEFAQAFAAELTAHQRIDPTGDH